MKNPGIRMYVSILVVMIVCLLPPIVEKVSSAPITLRFSAHLPARDAFVAPMVEAMDEIEKRTKGEVKFQKFFDGTLIGARDSWEELLKGTADIVVISAHNSPGVKAMPLFVTVNNGWVGVKDVRTQLKIMKQLFKEFPELVAEWSAVKPLTWHGTLEITLHTKKRVQTLADLKGMQIKGVGSWPKYTIEKLGASLVAIPAAEVYLALQKGIVDGVLLEASVLKSFRLAEVTQFTTNIGGVYTGVTTTMAINMNTWKKLPPDIQKLFEEMGEWMNERQLQIRENLLKEALDFAKEKKHEFTSLPAQELEKLHDLLREEAFEEAKKIGPKEPQARKILTRMYELIKQTK